MTLGQKIRELLTERGWSHYKLAELTGMSRPTITMIVNDKRRPRAEYFIKLAEAFNIDVDILFMAAGYVSNTAEAHVREQTPETLLEEIKLKVRQLEKHIREKAEEEK